MKVAIAIVLLLFVAMIGKCGLNFYKMVDEFPEQAHIDNLRARYPELIVDLDNAIELSDSAFSLAAELEDINYPDDTLSVSMDDGSDDALSIVNRFNPSNSDNGNSSLTAVVNGGGYGRKNGQHYWILQYPLNKYEYDHIEILLEREFPEQPETPLME